MMRPITCLSLVVAMGAGLYLYQEKHQAQLLDREIGRTVKLVEQARQRVGLLKAEKAVMEEPQRLAALVAHHLPLQPLAPGQFVRLDDLPGRLPAPGAQQTPPSTAVASVSPPPVGTATPTAPLPAPPEPAPPAAQVALLASLAAPSVPHNVAPPPGTPKPGTPKPGTIAARTETVPTSRTVFAPVMPAYVPTTVAVHPPTIQNASATAAAVASPYPSYVGSALGMARTELPAPAPVGAGQRSAIPSLASATSLGYAAGR